MKKLSLLLCSLLFVVVSCKDDPTEDSIDSPDTQKDLVCEDCGIEITKDDSRLEESEEEISVNPVGTSDNTSRVSKAAGANKNEIRFVLRAQVKPLYVEHKGQKVLLNANHISVGKKRVAASYSLVGAPYSGGVDVLSISNSGKVSLDGTLILPNRDVDAIDFIDDDYLVLGGGFDATDPKLYGGDYPSFMGNYELDYNNKTKKLSIAEENLFHSKFGNKLRSIKMINDFVTGSGGGNSGIIFAYNEKSGTIIENNSTETAGLFILDTTIETDKKENKFVALAFDNVSKILKAFYYNISKETDVMTYSYHVNLGKFENVDLEAKHSVAAPQKDYLAVSLGKEGLGLYQIKDSDKVDPEQDCGCGDETLVNNGGFEKSTISGNQAIVKQNLIVGWHTTASDELIEIWKSGFFNVKSASGNYFAEINGTQKSAMYQVICTQPGSVIKWSVKHRGRAGKDVAAVKIGGSVKEAKQQKLMSTDNKEWVEYSDSYVVPDGQYKTYIVFDAVSTAQKGKDSNSVGNFIDDFKVEVTKKVECEDESSEIEGDGAPVKAELVQIIKKEILEEGNPNHVVNSFVYDGKDTFYIAAGGAGFFIMDYDSKTNRLDKGNILKAEVKDNSINSVTYSDGHIVTASTIGVSIYEISKK